MKVAVFSTKRYDRQFLDSANRDVNHELLYLEPRLDAETVALASDCQAVCAFVNDQLSRSVLEGLSKLGVQFIALRCAGYNQVDVAAAKELGLRVVRVPAYSPHAVAEYTVGLMLTLNRKIHRAVSRVREGNFSLDGLLGFDFHGRTVGVVGTGQIGAVVARIMSGFGCQLLGHDVRQNAECVSLGMRYCNLDELLATSDIVTLHCPLIPQTHHLINAHTVSLMKRGAMLINTSRGAVIDTHSVIVGLKNGTIGSLGLDVYEEEADYFFEDRSQQVIDDDVLARLLTFPNVVISSHQAFFTEEAMSAIARTTMQNLQQLVSGDSCPNEVTA